MHKEITGKKFGLTAVTRLVTFVIIMFFLLSNLVVADAQNKAKSEDKNIAKYQGTLSGEWDGQVSVANHSATVSGTFSITISADGKVSGTYSGLQSGTITGTINNKGELNAEGSAGISDWSGQLSVEDGRLSGSGTWQGYGGGGLWKSK